MSLDHAFALPMTCPKAEGIMHAGFGLLRQAGCNTADSQPFGDLDGEAATGQAHPRGLKLIGATAHNATCMVLARAVRGHRAHRVLVNGRQCGAPR